MQQLVVWILDMQCYGVLLSAVLRVVRAVEVTPLPAAPGSISGIVDIQGQIVPVADMRRRLRLPSRDIALTDQLILAQTARRQVAFFADAVTGIATCPDSDIVSAAKMIPGLEGIAGIAKLDDGLILIHDLDRFLSLEEEETLDKAIENAM